MKNLLLLLSFLTILSCSSSDDNSNKSSTTLHPPTWIQGTWGELYDDGTVLSKDFKFTTNNFYHILPGSEVEVFPKTTGVTVNFVEEITDNKYYITATFNGTTTKLQYFFDKVSPTKIKLQNTAVPDFSPTYTKIE